MASKKNSKVRSPKDGANPKKFKKKTSVLVTDKRSEEHTSELQSHSFISYAVF